MITRPFASVGFSFVFALLILNLIDGSAVVLAASAVGCVLIAAFVKSLPGRAEYIVCALGVAAACISFTAEERLVYSPSLDLVGDDIAVSAKIDDIRTVSTGTYYTLDAEMIDGVQADCKMQLRTDEPLDASVGDTLNFIGDIKVIGANEESHAQYKSKGVFLRCVAGDSIEALKAEQKPLGYYIMLIKTHIGLTLEELVGGDTAGLAVSMLTGDKGSLSSQMNNAFKVCGLSHTLAVSGLHMNIIVLALYKLVSRIFSRAKRLSALICIPIALFYVALSGFSVSAVRACIMIIVMLFGKVISRRSDSLNSLGLAALIIALINPYAVLDWSFMLSFSSTLGIVLVSPLLKKSDAAIRNRLRPKFVSGLAVSLVDAITVSCVATAFTLPVMILFVGSFSLIFAPANLAVFFAVPVMMVSGAFTVLLGLLPISFPADAAAFVCRFTGKYISDVVTALSQPALARVNISSFAMKLWLAVSLAVVALAVYLMKNKKKAYALCTAFVCVSLLVTCSASAVKNKGAVTVTAVNVEDGACFVVSYGTSAVLIGCSGDDYIVNGVLNELGIIKLELVVFPTGTDEDYNCLDGFYDNYIVECVVTSHGCNYEQLPEDTVRADSFSFDFHGKTVSYISDGEYDYCTLDSKAGRALFVFGTDTPQMITDEELKADFLFSQAQPPLWLDTSGYKAVIVSAGGDTYVTGNGNNYYSTYDNSDLTLVFNEWGKYKINRL